MQTTKFDAFSRCENELVALLQILDANYQFDAFSLGENELVVCPVTLGAKPPLTAHSPIENELVASLLIWLQQLVMFNQFPV